MNTPFQFATIDWVIIGLSIAVSFLPALFFWKRASSGTGEFFTAGRAAPWWLVGISMVATTFSTDTPNLVTNFVREGNAGVAGNWAWWSFLLTGMATVFFYARRPVAIPQGAAGRLTLPVSWPKESLDELHHYGTMHPRSEGNAAPGDAADGPPD